MHKSLWPSILIYVVLQLQHPQHTNAENVLCLFTTRSPSHLIISLSTVKGIIENGHNVTVVTILPISDPNPKPGYRHIQLGIAEETKDIVKDVVRNGNRGISTMLTMYKYINLMFTQSNASLNDFQMRNLMDESFDLVILGYFFNEFYLGLAAHFKCPTIVIWMVQPIQIAYDFVGNPIEAAYVPHSWSSFKQPMQFHERLINFVEAIMDSGLKWTIYYLNSLYYRSNFPDLLYPKYPDILKNISLVLVNHHFSQTPVKPLVPAMVEIGGIQIKEKLDPLPNPIRQFFDDTNSTGMIYFSLGSNIKMKELDAGIIQTFYNVLSTLHMKVLWKWESDELPGNSTNILFQKWLPQNEVLANPKVRLFITHGGFGSITEAQYYGVPMLVIPFFNDQHSNARFVERSELGVTLNHAQIIERTFREAIQEVLSKEKYRNNIQSLSKIYRDRPMTPKETATFWIEYVLRHRGAPHMQCPSVHMNFIQYYSLDVIIVLISCTYIIIRIIKELVHRLVRVPYLHFRNKLKTD